LVPPARRFERAAAVGKATILAWRFGLATSQVRAQASHSYSCRSRSGRRERIRGDWQNGQDVRPGMQHAPEVKTVVHSLFEWGAERKLILVQYNPPPMEPLLRDVRLYIYSQMVATSAAPTAAETAIALSRDRTDIEAAYQALSDQHQIVLRPGSTTVWMAMPFSNMQTPFTVIADGRAYYANCAWDAFGVAAMLHRDARIFTTCADCGGALERKVAGGRVTDERGLVHFALPARRWWDDVGYT
jgi:hypothetical protein